jgi:uncharacterized protein (DUF924 family)
MDHQQAVLSFWLETCGPADWYIATAALDATITDRFEGLWHDAMKGKLEGWTITATGTLAYLILTDQFPRNMFRGSAQAFASDRLARAAAKKGLKSEFDLRTAVPQRQFFYMPLEHSECLCDQDRAVRLIASRMGSDQTLLHARAHRNIIRTFGRFPFRNVALGRTSTAQESAFLKAGGYGAVVQELQRCAA